MSEREAPTKEQGLTFENPAQCLEDLERKIANKPPGIGRRWKERQRKCMTCGRWKYEDERCNLFSTVKQ